MASREIPELNGGWVKLTTTLSKIYGSYNLELRGVLPSVVYILHLLKPTLTPTTTEIYVSVYTNIPIHPT